MTTEERLAEREKELACIYSICLLAAEAPDAETVADGVARSLRSAVRHEEKAWCEVDFRNALSGRTVRLTRGDGAPATSGKDAKAIEAHVGADAFSGNWRLSIRLGYGDGSLGFLPQEKALLDSVLIVAASILRTSSLIADLSSKNTALREVLSVIEDERRAALAGFRERLSAELLPLAERARDPGLTDEKRQGYLDLLIDEIGRDVTAFGPDPAAHGALSPREREVAVQVRNGRTSKEIAELLGIAEATVERHRHNIRRKFKIANKAVNLAGILSNDDSAGEGPAYPAR